MMFTGFFKRSVLCAALFFAGAGAMQTASAENFTIATDGTFAPFEFHDSKTNELIGFEIDLVHAMVAKMGATVDIKEYKFDAILPAIMSHSLDFAAAGFAINPERAKRVLFTDPFYQSGLTITVAKGNPEGVKSFDDLAGKRVSVQLGSVAHDRVKKIPGAKVSTFESAAEAMMNLMSGNADAVVNSAPATDYMIKMRPALAKNVVRLNFIEKPADMAMVIPKDNPELQQRLNKALAEIRADGTYDKIHEKWFGRPAK